MRAAGALAIFYRLTDNIIGGLFYARMYADNAIVPKTVLTSYVWSP